MMDGTRGGINTCTAHGCIGNAFNLKMYCVTEIDVISPPQATN